MRRHRSAIVDEVAPFDGSMNDTPSDVATAARGRSTISIPGSRPSAIAASISVSASRSRPGLPKRTVGARRGVDDAGLVVERVAAEQLGKHVGHGQLVRGSRPGRPARPDPVPAVDRSAMPVNSVLPRISPVLPSITVRSASDAARTVPSSVTSRWSTGWPTEASSTGVMSPSGPPRPIRSSSTVEIVPSSSPRKSRGSVGSMARAPTPGAVIRPIV